MCVPIVVACRCPVCVQWHSREPLSVYIKRHARTCSTHQTHGQIGCDSRQLACNAILTAAPARAARRRVSVLGLPAPRAASGAVDGAGGGGGPRPLGGGRPACAMRA